MRRSQALRNFAQRSAPDGRPVAGIQLETARGAGPLELQVKPANLIVSIVEHGVLDAARHNDVFSAVKGISTIIQLTPEGTQVNKGEIVCLLDAAPCAISSPIIRSRLKRQARISTRPVRSRTRRSGSHCFCRGYFKTGDECAQERGCRGRRCDPEGRKAARSNEARRERISELMTSKKGAVATTDILAQLDVEDRVDASEQAISREKAALELAQSKLDVLEKFTRNQRFKMLTLQVEEKRAEELAKQARWHFEQSKAKSLERQIAACTIKAPEGGTVLHANPPRQLARGLAFGQIEEGATVRERQKILSIIDLNGKTLVIARVEESQIKKITLGMKATIRIDAFPGQSFDGTVIEVSPLPVPSSSNDGDKRFFATKVKIDNGVPGLRPGRRRRSNSWSPSSTKCSRCRRMPSFLTRGNIV